MVNYKAIVKNLQKKYSDAIQVIVVSNSGKIIYSTNNWDVKSDIKGILSSWGSGNAQFVHMNEIRYSVLQMEPERFIATNRKKKGHLIGAATPDGSKYVLAHIKPKAKGWYHLAYPSVARAAAMMVKDSKLKSHEPKVGTKKGKKKKKVAIREDSTVSDSVVSVMVEKPDIDPDLKREIEEFLEWIKNPDGLAGYISYYLQQNDQKKISELATIYNTLHRICKS